MENIELVSRVPFLSTATIADLVDVNDWAVNVVRNYCWRRGYNAAALLAEETARIDSKCLDLDGYIREVRTGSNFCLDRMTRRALFTAIATRRAVNAAA